MSFGDVQWAERDGGRVSRGERLGQLWEVLRFRVGQRVRRTPRALGARSPDEVDRMMAEVELPRSEHVERAASLVAELGPEALTGHVLRTYAWGSLLGMRDGLSWNKETFALAALLHDLALARRDDGVCCFAADGAMQAMKLLEDWSVPEAVRRRVGDAVCMHVRVAVPPELGVEAHLVHAGAGVDVIGRRFSEIAPELRERVLERHPRGRLKAFLTDFFTRDAQQNPDSRMGLWIASGFADRIRRAPFES
jgi:hypothetical protein